jgi:hypothetical protein
MATHTPPVTFSSTVADVGFPFVFAEQDIRAEIADRLNVLALGVVPLVGDLAGAGSDTVRVTRIGGVGWQLPMTTMGSEVAAITPTGFRTGFDTITIARHGLAMQESYTNQILSREPAVLLEDLKARLPDSWLKTFRQKVAAAGAGFTGAVGNTGLAWTFDDELALVAFFHETEGFEGEAITMRHPEQFTDLRESIRVEPNFQFPEITAAIQGLRPGGGAMDFLGFRNFATFDITDSGGDHQGFAMAPGAIGWAVASTLGVKVEDPLRAMFIPEFGLVCEQKSDGNVATGQFDANSYFGVATADPSIAPQTRLISIND